RVHVHEAGSFAPLLQVEQGQVFTVVNDHLGMPKELVDGRGRVAWAARHSAWGRILEEQRDPGVLAVGSPFRLLGQYADDETGLCWVRFRYFDAEAGRWCSPDPLGPIGGPNQSAFHGSPTNRVDAVGLSTTCPPPPRDARTTHLIHDLRGANTPWSRWVADQIESGAIQVRYPLHDPYGQGAGARWHHNQMTMDIYNSHSVSRQNMMGLAVHEGLHAAQGNRPGFT